MGGRPWQAGPLPVSGGRHGVDQDLNQDRISPMMKARVMVGGAMVAAAVALSSGVSAGA